MSDATRYAIVLGDSKHVSQYLPSCYAIHRDLGEWVTISGIDSAGWTLTDYVIPRLASGLYPATETTALQANACQPAADADAARESFFSVRDYVLDGGVA